MTCLFNKDFSCQSDYKNIYFDYKIQTFNKICHFNRELSFQFDYFGPKNGMSSHHPNLECDMYMNSLCYIENTIKKETPQTDFV